MDENSVQLIDRLDIEAKLENIPIVVDFIEQRVRKLRISEKELAQILIVTEEIFTNIASYAYTPDIGMACLIAHISEENNSVEITFMDSGVRFNPLDLADPDITLKAKERKKGGLGYFFVKKKVDSITYKYDDGMNIVCIEKIFKGDAYENC